jgi:hypothetical protein
LTDFPTAPPALALYMGRRASPWKSLPMCSDLHSKAQFRDEDLLNGVYGSGMLGTALSSTLTSIESNNPSFFGRHGHYAVRQEPGGNSCGLFTLKLSNDT